MIMNRFYVCIILSLIIIPIITQRCQGVSIDSIPRDTREKLCNETKAACADACSQKQESKCDSETLNWECYCLYSSSSNNSNINMGSNGSNDDKKMIGKNSKPLNSFPIPKKMCSIDLALCQGTCQHLGEHGNVAKVCRLQCDGSFPCGSTNAPVYNGTTIVMTTNTTSALHQQQNDSKANQQQSLSITNTTPTRTKVIMIGMMIIFYSLLMII
ncbi:hypothetical protein BDC45DRAFT_343700 [Circinella umbellata]|nr:hypothetical protein BDC45DRAFT_343700 [Circinella umbellata]